MRSRSGYLQSKTLVDQGNVGIVNRDSLRTHAARIGLVAAIIVASVTPSFPSTSSTRLCFEEVAAAADVIVLGTVVERPRLARSDRKKTHVYTHNRVAVDRYLKGEGQREIIVKTYGGNIEVDIPGEPREQFVSYLGMPSLPDVGTRVLLFLKGSRGSYKIYSASHGVVHVLSREDGAEWVGLKFRNPRVMPSGSRADYERLKSQGFQQWPRGIPDFVSTEDLDLLIRIALDPSEAEAAPRVRSFDLTVTP